MSIPPQLKSEVERIRRVADLLCTGHAGLRDRYARRALALDLLIFAVSIWLVALTFVEPRINSRLTPFGWDSQVWIGCLGVATFFLNVFQFKTDWKGRSDAHKQTHTIYAEVKREAGYVLAKGDADEAAYLRVLARYDMASAVGVEMPEADFLLEKRRHLLKVAMSKHLDDHPSSSLVLLRVRLWYRDNMRSASNRP